MSIPVSKWPKAEIYTCQYCHRKFGKIAKRDTKPKYCTQRCSGLAAVSRPAKLKPKTVAQAYAEICAVMPRGKL